MSAEMKFGLDEQKKLEKIIHARNIRTFKEDPRGMIQELANTGVASYMAASNGLPSTEHAVFKFLLINTENKLENILHQVGSNFRK